MLSISQDDLFLYMQISSCAYKVIKPSLFKTQPKPNCRTTSHIGWVSLWAELIRHSTRAARSPTARLMAEKGVKPSAKGCSGQKRQENRKSEAACFLGVWRTEEEEEGGIQMGPCLPTNTLGRCESYSFAIAKEPHHCPSALTSQKGSVSPI